MNEQNIPQTSEPIQSSKHIWITIIAVALTAIVIGGGVYAWQQSSMQKTEQSLQQQITALQNQIADLQKPTQSAITTPEETQEPTPPADETADTDIVPRENAKEVVENYVKYTLGIPANYDLAKQYLTPELQSQFDTTPGFVPRSYGIQDVPYSTTVNTKNTSENKATIQVIGQYDSSQVIWEFTVMVYNNEWKISAINKI